MAQLKGPLRGGVRSMKFLSCLNEMPWASKVLGAATVCVAQVYLTTFLSTMRLGLCSVTEAMSSFPGPAAGR